MAMDEVSAPVIAIGLVLTCVFVPCVFISGITGLFFRQFALTIAISTVLSTMNSLTLSPALCAVLLKERHAHRDPLSWIINFCFGWFFKLFNKAFTLSISGYTRAVGKLLRLSLLVLLVYGGLLYLTVWSFGRMPTGFIPNQDQGFLLLVVQLPDSASLERTEEVMARADAIIRGTKGVGHVIRVSGMSFVLGATGRTWARCSWFSIPSTSGDAPELRADVIAAELQKKLYKEIEDANFHGDGRPASPRAWHHGRVQNHDRRPRQQRPGCAARPDR